MNLLGLNSLGHLYLIVEFGFLFTFVLLLISKI
jgi:hypothetical protein